MLDPSAQPQPRNPRPLPEGTLARPETAVVVDQERLRQSVVPPAPAGRIGRQRVLVAEGAVLVQSGHLERQPAGAERRARPADVYRLLQLRDLDPAQQVELAAALAVARLAVSRAVSRAVTRAVTRAVSRAVSHASILTAPPRRRLAAAV